MSAITEQFGTDAHVVMGAAIDEALQGRVEICVMGVTDVGGRNFVRRGTNPPMRKPEKPTTATSAAPGSTTNVKTVVTPDHNPRNSAKAGAVHPEKPQQEEFGFGGHEPAENRGTFDKSDRNLFEGQDLDVPTFLRKGIKVAL
jgi:cell division protein FtsZ